MLNPTHFHVYFSSLSTFIYFVGMGNVKSYTRIPHVTCEPWTRVWTPRTPGSRWGFCEDLVSINWGLEVNWGWPSEYLKVDLAVKRGACLGQELWASGWSQTRDHSRTNSVLGGEHKFWGPSKGRLEVMWVTISGVRIMATMVHHQVRV